MLGGLQQSGGEEDGEREAAKQWGRKWEVAAAAKQGAGVGYGERLEKCSE
jgi:hypothetical protein